MASFVTLDEYEDAGGDVSDPIKAQAALEDACDEVRSYLGQRIDLVAGDVVTLQGTGTRTLLLPEVPVVSIASVVVDGTAVTSYTVDKDFGVMWRTDGYSWTCNGSVVVTYTHGFAVVPGDIKRVVYKLAMGGLTGPVTQETVGPFSVSYGSSSSPLAALALRRVKKVPLP